MDTFELWAVKGRGAPQRLAVRAATRIEAAAQLAAQGFSLLDGSGRSRRALPPWGNVPRAPSWQRPSLASDLFAEQMLALLQAGIGPVEALRALEQQAHSKGQPLLRKVLTDLEHGRTLADALAAAGGFDELMVALVRASEHTSDLPAALERYLQHAQQTKAVRQRIVTASVYPALLLVVGVLVMVFLLAYVIPRFSGIFASIHTELPWTAQWLMRWGGWVKAYGGWMAVAAAGGGAGLAAAVASPRVRAAVFGWLLQRPYVGHYVRLSYLARLYRTVGTLLEGGIPFPRALQMAAGLLPLHLRSAAAAALEQVSQGQAPSKALADNGLSSPVAEQLLLVGQRSGELGAMMLKTASFHEGETSRAIERFMRALEPAVMALLGVCIGGVVILMYLPIFELASAVR